MEAPLVDDLFRQLVSNKAFEPQSRLESYDIGQVTEVMYEVDINGIHYALTRTYQVLGPEQINLSPREKEIVRLIAKGMATKAIATNLDVSPWTIASHLRRVFTKLGVNSRAEMIAHVLQHGLIKE